MAELVGECIALMPILVERSLFKTGEDSLAVTLPKAWTRYLHLKAGDRVLIVANDELVIRLKDQEKQEEKV